jgi:hypothetical protein
MGSPTELRPSPRRAGTRRSGQPTARAVVLRRAGFALSALARARRTGSAAGNPAAVEGSRLHAPAGFVSVSARGLGVERVIRILGRCTRWPEVFSQVQASVLLARGAGRACRSEACLTDCPGRIGRRRAEFARRRDTWRQREGPLRSGPSRHSATRDRWACYLRPSIHRPILASSTSSGTAPSCSTSAWKARRSNFAPSSASARSRSSCSFSSPIL